MSFDDKLVKKAYSAISYTPQMVEELKNCLDPKSGPSYFIEHFVQLQHPIRGRIPFTFFDYQRELCEVYHQNRYSVAMVSRQMGKTALAAAYLLWFAMFKPDSTVLVAAHKHSGAQEIMQRIRFAYENLPDHIRAGVISYNKNSLEFDNGSRIIAQTTTPTTGRGLAISCLRTDSSEVTVRDKETGEIRTLTIRELLEMNLIHTTQTPMKEEWSTKMRRSPMDSLESVVLEKNSRFEVLTTDGFKHFDGITVTVKPCVRLTLKNHKVECTADHKFFSITHNKWKQCQDLKVGESIRTADGSDQVVNIDAVGEHEVSDLVNVQDTHSFIANGIDAHNCIYADEFAYVRPSIAREFWTSISPALSTGGKCIITSTPNVDDDQFAEIWFGSQRNIDQNGLVTQVGSNGFCGYMATWEAHPERDQEWAKAEQEKISEELFRREHLCEFVSFSETLISGIKLLGLQGRDPVRTQAQVRWYEPIRDQQTYVASLDPAMGTGGDPAVIQILELPALKQVAEWRCNRTRPEQQVQVLKSILEEINQTAPNSEIYWSLENNSVGESVLVAIREIDEETIPGTFMHGKRAAGRSRKGYSTTNPTKLEACSRLKMLVESGRFLPASRILVHELKHFVAAGNTYRANTGETDDCIMALLIALRMAKDISAWDDNLSQALSSALHEQDSQDEAEPMPVIV